MLVLEDISNNVSGLEVLNLLLFVLYCLVTLFFLLCQDQAWVTPLSAGRPSPRCHQPCRLLESISLTPFEAPALTHLYTQFVSLTSLLIPQAFFFSFWPSFQHSSIHAEPVKQSSGICVVAMAWVP